MSDAEGANPDTVDGEVIAELIPELEEGWAPLPTKTLFALVLSGLRVRVMRSLVTMVSIVLAIAFLTYTGLSNKLYFNLAGEVRRLRDLSPTETKRVAAAASVVLEADLFGELSPDLRREAAVQLGMAEIDRQIQELGRLAGPLSKARGDLEEARKGLAKARADPDPIEADIEAARTKVRDARATLDSAERREHHLSAEIELGRWLASGGRGSATEALPSGLPELAERLLEALADRRKYLLGKATRFVQLDEEEMGQAEALLALAARSPCLASDRGPQHHPDDAQRRAGTGGAVATLRKALDEARTERAATKLSIDLRRAGINVESTLEGTSLDTWLIIMALMTCTVGIANAVLMSVTERFREIGTMKCLGAQDSLVVKMFLLESVMLGMVGALMGIALGVLVALTAGVTQFGGFGLHCFPLAQGVWVVCWSLLAGMFLAVVGAVYPVLVAARMQPVDALRADE